MLIDASKVDNINAAIGGTSGSQATLDNTFNDFLLLLTTQLENQDPTEPMDTNQITDQIASMTQVQEQINTNKYLQELVSLSGGNEIDTAVNYIGRAIETSGDQSNLYSDGENSAAVFLYDLPAQARTAEILIKDSTNRIVYRGEALTNAGRNEVVWDGYNNLNQQQMPPGAYSFQILAKDFNNNDIAATTFTTGIVTSADTQNGEVTLSLGNIRVPVDDVTAIKSAQELL